MKPLTVVPLLDFLPKLCYKICLGGGSLNPMGPQNHPGLAHSTWLSWNRNDCMTDLLAAAIFLGFVLWLITKLAQRASRHFPPGPKGLPLVGDVFHIADQDWLGSPQRKDEYGNVP